MEYRELGATGQKVSAIGLGCEHLDGKPYSQVKEVVSAALDSGMNVFDVFMPGREVRENIAKALGSRRRDVMIQGHIGSTDVNQQYDISRDMPTAKRYFEDMLRAFGGHIEFGMLFFIDSDEDYTGAFDGGLADYAQRLKQNGDIGHIGFSSHNPRTALKAIETGLPEMLMFSVNPGYDMLPVSENALDRLEKDFEPGMLRGLEPARAELYRVCQRRQVGITVMKTLGAGKLLSPEHTPFVRPLTVPQCVHYALSRPAAASVLLGCQSSAEVYEAVRYFETSDAERDYAEVLGSVRNDFRGNCVYCNHCQPCPAEIDIAAVHKYLDIARLTPGDVPPSVRSHYLSLARHGSDCTSCGSCEARCPFGVPVINDMAEAVEVFGE